MAQNSIGIFQFPIMHVVAGTLTRAIEVIERPNVTGAALRSLAQHGQSFMARTIDDQADIADCRQQLAAYKALKGSGPVILVANDLDYHANDGFLVAVLEVSPIRMQKSGIIAGGLNPGAAALLYAAWQLKAWEP